MNAKTFVVLFVLLFVVFIGLSLEKDAAASGGCDIQDFTMTPVDPYTLGTHVVLEGWSNCGTVKFTIENLTTHVKIDKAETGSSHQFETWKTEETGTGTFDVCFVARGDGGWENANRRCRTVYVEGGQAPPPGSESGGIVRCWVNVFDVTPLTIQMGQTANFASQGQCDGNMRAARYLIDGQGWGEHATTTYYTGWNTSGYAAGDHQVCYEITGGSWEDAARSCQYVTLQSEAPAVPDVGIGPQTTNDVPGQTPDSNPSMVDHPQGNPPPTEPLDGENDPSVSGSTGSSSCPGAPTRLSPGMLAIANDNLVVRSAAGTGNAKLRDLPVRSVVTVISGPVCASGYRWYEVGDSGWSGWVVEIITDVYLLLPNGTPLGAQGNTWNGSGTVSVPAPASTGGSCGFPPVLSVGDTGEVTYTFGDGLNVRSGSSSDYTQLARLFQGDTFTVLSGTDCGEGYRWIHVRTSNGTEGWMVESDGQDVYVARVGSGGVTQTVTDGGYVPSNGADSPYPDRGIPGATGGYGEDSCAGPSLSPLGVGDEGQVVAGVNPNLYGGPGVGWELLGTLSSGTTFSVVEGPYCNDTFWFIQVNATSGQSGWIAVGTQTSMWVAEVGDQWDDDSEGRYTYRVLNTCRADPLMSWYIQEPSDYLSLMLPNFPKALGVIASLMDVTQFGIKASTNRIPDRVDILFVRDLDTGLYHAISRWYLKDEEIRIQFWTYDSAEDDPCPEVMMATERAGLSLGS
jgi:uncharacterized protein YraI